MIKALLIIWFSLFFFATAFGQEQLFFQHWKAIAISEFPDGTKMVIVVNPDQQKEPKFVVIQALLISVDNKEINIQVLGYAYEENGKIRKFIQKGNGYVEENQAQTL